MRPGPFLAATAAVILALAAAPAAAQPPQFRAAVLYEPTTDTFLYEHNADAPLRTASTIKMLTALVVSDAVRAGEIDWDTPLVTTRDAAYVEGSQVYLEEGEVFTVGELVDALLIKSANDVAYALAEGVGGSVEEFLQRMRATARALGVRNFSINSPHGLPHPAGPEMDDRITARGLALIGAEVLRRPELRRRVATDLAWFRNGEFQLYSGNHLLRRWDLATGIKTGYTVRADFTLAASGRLDGMELIAVVLGSERKWDSFEAARRLLEAGFANYRLIHVADEGEPLGQVPVRGGGRTGLVAAADVNILLPRWRPVDLDVRLLANAIQAPVEAAHQAGQLVVRCAGEPVTRVPAVTAEAVEPPSWWQRLTALIAGIF